MRFLWAMAAVAAIAVAGGSASADDRAVAREHFQKGSKAFELGLYDEAIAEYTAAYKAKDDPSILYNMAQAHKLAGHTADALRFYRMFLIKEPDAANRDEVLGKIEMLNKALEQQRKAQSMPPDTTLPAPAAHSPDSGVKPPQSTAAPPAAANPEPAPSLATRAPDRHAGRTKKIVGIVLGVVGVAALGAGLGLELAAKQTSDDLTAANQGGQPFDQDQYSAGKAKDGAGVALLAVGGAAAVAAIVVGVLGLREAKASRVAWVPWLSATGAGAAIEVRR